MEPDPAPRQHAIDGASAVEPDPALRQHEIDRASAEGGEGSGP